MFDSAEYELLDFGEGRKLERFGRHILDRPCPAAESQPRQLDQESWEQAQARFRRGASGKGSWRPAWPADTTWPLRHGSFTLQLKPTQVGHLGVFPEQAPTWDWIAKQVRRENRPLKVLNLFAYTGASTLAAASAGAEVVHVDAAKNVVQWARRNAEASQLGEHNIRWIAEDALRFVRREVKRGNHYDAVILDPPSYGHGPKGEVWKVARDLPQLLELCGRLIQSNLSFVMLSCHSAGFGPAELQAAMLGAFFAGSCQAGGKAGEMTLSTPDNRRLNCGAFARWPA